jgi:hypothetical protein
MFGSQSSQTPVPPPIPDPPPNPASFGASTFAAGKRNAPSTGGYGSTILTGGQGLTAPANTQRKTLLGQ